MLECRHDVVGVVTAPPARAGRGLVAAANEVADLAAARGVPTLRPARARDAEFLREFAAWRPDLAVVVAYGQILSREFLTTPRLACINLHGSLLPRWRGASPVQAALRAGDAETGVCLQRVVEELDAGEVLARRATPIGPREEAPALAARLAELGAALLREFLDALPEDASALPPGEAQDAARVTHCRKIRKEHATLDWSASADEVERFVRAMAGWPVARTALADGGALLVHRGRALAESSAAAPGTVLRLAPELVVACGAGAYVIEELQREGRARLSAVEFLRGVRLGPGDRLGGYPDAPAERS